MRTFSFLCARLEIFRVTVKDYYNVLHTVQCFRRRRRRRLFRRERVAALCTGVLSSYFAWNVLFNLLRVWAAFYVWVFTSEHRHDHVLGGGRLWCGGSDGIFVVLCSSLCGGYVLYIIKVNAVQPNGKLRHA